MATFVGSLYFLSHPIKKILSFSSQTPPPSPPPQPQPQSQPPSLCPSLSEQQVPPQPPASVKVDQPRVIKPATTAESTDWIASTLSRRFGLGAGLAWAAFLAFGVVSEQIKTRLEVSQQEANTRNLDSEEEVLLPNGIRYYDLRVGGGDSPRQGDLIVIDLKGRIEGSGDVFVDTFGREKKPLALVMGSRPYTKGMCEGIEYALRTMKAGGKRRVIIPPSMGFGEKGEDLVSGAQVPPFATLEYTIELDNVSIAPA